MVALLYNNTIEIHSLATLSLVQVLQLPTTTIPRSLARVASGIDIGHDREGSKSDLVSLPLWPRDEPRDEYRTPTKRRNPISPPAAGIPGPGPLTKVLLVGKNSLHAVAPLTLVAQLEALLERDRLPDALDLAGQVERSDPARIVARTFFFFLSSLARR